jgi:adenylate cyclase
MEAKAEAKGDCQEEAKAAHEAKAEDKTDDIDDELLPRRIRKIKSSFIKRVAVFCDSDNLLEELEAYCIDNSGSFEECEEHSLENTETHRKYTQLIERKLELFMEKEGVSEQDFYRQCSEAQNNQDDPAADTFVQMLLGAIEFEHFALLMQQLRESHSTHK